jgi:glycosyltransferase involved in cell wall biosynthesis
MNILLMGPTETAAIQSATGLDFSGAPAGTAQTPLAPLAASLLALGHEVTVLSFDPTIAARVQIRRGRLTLVYCPLRAPPHFRTRVRSLDLFAREIAGFEEVIRDIDPDIVHAHWTYEFAEAAVRSKYPHLVTMHDLGWNYLFIFQDIYRLMRLVMKYRVMPRIKNLTCVAPFMRLRARHYGNFGMVTVVPNGVAIPGMATLPSVDRYRLLKFVTVGNSGPIKNVRRSIEAFRLVRMVHPQAELHLFGPGLDQEFAGGESHVLAHGNVPHPELMRFLKEEASLLVHPSLIECCPVIIAEAKARGVPAIGGRKSGGVSFVVGEGEGGRLVDVKSSTQIAEAMLSLLSDEAQYQRESLAARKDAIARFSDDKVAEQYIQIYTNILADTDTRKRASSA